MNITYDKEKTILETTLPGRPSSTNHLYGQTGNRRYMTTEGKDTKEAYTLQMMSEYRGDPFTDKCELILDLYFDTRHKRDWDNYNKIVCDAIEEAGVIENDNQIDIGVVRKHYDKESPRIELTLLEQ